MIKLYTWGTPNGNKLHSMLEETHVPYELIPVNLGKGEQRDCGRHQILYSRRRWSFDLEVCQTFVGVVRGPGNLF
jgi:hypothetical protein